VVATNIGGLPEAVGDGGVLIDVDAGADAWAQAVHALWSDEALYEGLSAKALAHSGREAMQIEAQMDAWGRVIESALAGAAS
jgi:glycosyltransferase involved in cell wall biosynthesis